MAITVLQLWKTAPVSVSAADITICFNSCYSTFTGEFNNGDGELSITLLLMWKYPDARLLALGEARYTTLDSIWSCMLLLWKRSLEFGCVRR